MTDSLGSTRARERTSTTNPAYPLNLPLTVEKQGGAWKIASMHFSTLASA